MSETEPQPKLDGKRLLLGVSGGIAAYKACELASRLVKEKAQVTVCLTKNAEQFVTPLSFEALTGRPCLTRTFRRIAAGESPYPHLTPALQADLAVLAPATADLIARLAAGLADDLLATLCLSVRAPLLVCPAMNVRMWEHPATQRNVRTLVGFGHRILGPAHGELACGMSGPGRMVEPAEIVKAIGGIFAEAALPVAPVAPGFKAKTRASRQHRAPKRKPRTAKKKGRPKEE